jgi:hypothetical protein
MIPIVSQRKYKGKPVTEMMRDSKYIETIKNENWFKKDELIYSICVHKKLFQNKKKEKVDTNIVFQKNQNIIKLIQYLYPSSENKKFDIGSYNYDGIFNWDLIIKDVSFSSIEEHDTNKKRYIPTIYSRFESKINDQNYVSILKKILLPIYLTDCENKNKLQYFYENIEANDKNKSKKDNTRNKIISDLKNQTVSKLTNPFMAKYVLLVEKCDSKYILLDDLKSIFKQNNIELVIISDIINQNEKLCNKEKVFENNEFQNEESQKEELKNKDKCHEQTELIDLENTQLLKNKINIYESKIDELEKENLGLKTNINILVVILIFNFILWLK